MSYNTIKKDDNLSIKKSFFNNENKIDFYSIPVNLIRQWCYCPRVVYYMELTKVTFHRPIWVKQGEQFHKIEKKLWERRNLSRFNLQNGKKHYNLTIKNESLGFHGIVDMAIETDKAIYPVEFKLSANSKKRGDQLQLSAYALLLEKHFGKPSPVGFLIGGEKTVHTIDISTNHRRDVMKVSNDIKQMLLKGLKPASSATVHQCCACEYINFCNDRL